MIDFNSIKTELFKQINDRVFHSYLKEYIPSPQIDEVKLSLLIAMCSEININKKSYETYIITTMLVQAALDTHELVKVGAHSNDHQQKIQQLMVLAGDYYSGLYYKLLAQIEDTRMIKVLAEGIKLINEHKIRVYRYDLTYPDSLIDSVRIIEGQLLKNIANYYKLTFWEEITTEILLLKRLIQEKTQLSHSGNSVISSYLIKELYESKVDNELSSSQLEKEIQTRFDLEIMSCRNRVKELLECQNHTHSAVIQELKLMVNQIEDPLQVKLEEG